MPPDAGYCVRANSIATYTQACTNPHARRPRRPRPPPPPQPSPSPPLPPTSPPTRHLPTSPPPPLRNTPPPPYLPPPPPHLLAQANLDVARGDRFDKPSELAAGADPILSKEGSFAPN